MRRRLYFVLPDVKLARRIANDLLLARIEDRYMHFLAKRGVNLGELHEASFLQKTDIIRGAEIGLIIGAAAGFVLGVMIFLTPPENVRLELVTILIATLGGGILGAWISSLIGASAPNARLQSFHDQIEHGKILLMVDVPMGRIEEVSDLIRKKHPEAVSGGIEATLPAFP